MPLHLQGRRALLALLIAGATIAACAPTYVVVPERREGYAARDTLRGRLKGKDVRVTFRHDTTWRTDTVVRWRTIWRDGPRVDTVFALDTMRRVDTVKVGRRPGTRVDTVRVVVQDTVRTRRPADNKGTGGTGTGTTGTGTGSRTGGGAGGPIIMPQRPADPRVDTLRVTVYDSVRITVYDTIRAGGVDTVRIPGRRTLFVPPGQYPPAGQCRVWIHDQPPGQQARPAACNALGQIPAGAFILFRGDAWDFDYDWLAYPAGAPPEIVALKRPGGGGNSPAKGRGRS